MRRHYILYSLLALFFTSCIETYNAELPDSETQMLCVEGCITGNRQCLFYLSTTLSLKETLAYLPDHQVKGAQLTVKGSDGSAYVAEEQGKGAYVVDLPQLDRNFSYWLEIETGGERYQSSAQQPIDSIGISDLRFDMPHDNRQVNLLISAVPPAMPSDKQYFRWNYERFWEVHTPLPHTWDYDLENDEIVAATEVKSRGFCQKPSTDIFIGTNQDYKAGHLADHCILSDDAYDNFFNYLGCYRVSQTAISAEEYEYYRLSKRQSQEMGGLFTPQPAELPSNITCTTDPSRHAIGFVGVSIGSVTRDLYVHNYDVGYKLTKQVPSYDEDNTKTRHELYKAGYRIYFYSSTMAGQQVTWTDRWCVDSTDPYWGASLEFPEWWVE